MASHSPLNYFLCNVLVGPFGRVTLSKIEVITEKNQKVPVSGAPSHQFFCRALRRPQAQL